MNFSHIIRLFLLALALVSCRQNQDRVIQQKVAARVEDFVKKERSDCQKELLTKANKIVDSLLLAEAQQQLRDSLNRQRPFRPEQPPNVPPIDSLEVKPIFPNKK